MRRWVLSAAGIASWMARTSEGKQAWSPVYSMISVGWTMPVPCAPGWRWTTGRTRWTTSFPACRSGRNRPRRSSTHRSLPHSEPGWRSDGSRLRSRQRRSASLRQTTITGVCAAWRRSSGEGSVCSLSAARACMRSAIIRRACSSSRATRWRCARGSARRKPARSGAAAGLVAIGGRQRVQFGRDRQRVVLVGDGRIDAVQQQRALAGMGPISTMPSTVGMSSSLSPLRLPPGVRAIRSAAGRPDWCA